MATGEFVISMMNQWDRLRTELSDPEYRFAFVEGHTRDTIAFQLREMRREKGWEQRDVAARLGNPTLQPMISRYENPDYGRYSVTTLLELARVFDVGLVVRFAPYSELLMWDLNKTTVSLKPPDYAHDSALQNASWVGASSMSQQLSTVQTEDTSTLVEYHLVVPQEKGQPSPGLDEVTVVDQSTTEEALNTPAVKHQKAA